MEHIFSKEGVSVEKGLAICKTFFSNLGSLLKTKLLPSNSESESYESYRIFCQIVCKGTGGSSEWNEVIFRVIKIQKEKQRDLELTPDDLFRCIIEFCRLYNQRYNSSLQFLLKFLESMKQEPASYRVEWQLLKKTIHEIGKRAYVPEFDWGEKFSEQEKFEEVKLDFYNSYTAVYLFLDSLWDYLQGKLSDKDKDEIGTLMGMAFNIPSWETDWETAILKFYGKIDKSSQMLSKDVFQVLIIFTTIFHEQFGCPCSFLLNLLHGMIENISKYKNEWRLWGIVIKNASIENYGSLGNGREQLKQTEIE